MKKIILGIALISSQFALAGDCYVTRNNGFSVLIEAKGIKLQNLDNKKDAREFSSLDGSYKLKIGNMSHSPADRSRNEGMSYTVFIEKDGNAIMNQTAVTIGGFMYINSTIKESDGKELGLMCSNSGSSSENH